MMEVHNVLDELLRDFGAVDHEDVDALQHAEVGRVIDDFGELGGHHKCHLVRPAEHLPTTVQSLYKLFPSACRFSSCADIISRFAYDIVSR